MTIPLRPCKWPSSRLENVGKLKEGTITGTERFPKTGGRTGNKATSLTRFISNLLWARSLLDPLSFALVCVLHLLSLSQGH